MGTRAHVLFSTVSAGNASYAQTSALEDSRRINAHLTTPCMYHIFLVYKPPGKGGENGEAVRLCCSPELPAGAAIPTLSKSHRSLVAGGAVLGARAAPAHRSRLPERAQGRGGWRAGLRPPAARVSLGSGPDWGKCPGGPGRLDPRRRCLTP